MKYVFDIDGTICSTDDTHNYESAVPYQDVIDEINRLYNEGNTITLYTARGSSSGLNWEKLTRQQLQEWGVKYHALITQKPSGDIYIDDKAENAIAWRKNLKKKKIGFVASAFDLFHAGHCLMLKDAKSKCDILIAALQVDPSVDRSHKNSPILSLHERYTILHSNKFVDRIIIYRDEKELNEILKTEKPDIRIVGSDYLHSKDRITGIEHCKEIYFHDRTTHNYSSTNIRERILKCKL